MGPRGREGYRAGCHSDRRHDDSRVRGKLFSPFGSYHHPAQPDAAPYHQLAVQYAATKAWAAGLQLRETIMIAVTADSARPIASLNQAEHDMERLTGRAPPGGVRWLPWHKITGILTGLLNRLKPKRAGPGARPASAHG